MTSALSLRAALKRGALVTAANWPVVFVDFIIESVFKFALAIPVIGGALMVAVLLGSDLRTLFAEGVLGTAELVFGSLASAPVALGAFLVAITLVAFGGGVIMAVIKAGTLVMLVTGEHAAGDLHRPPLRFDAFQRASAYRSPRSCTACASSGGGRSCSRPGSASATSWPVSPTSRRSRSGSGS